MNVANINEYKEFNQEKFTKRIVFKEGGSTSFVLNFKSGQELPAHKHPGTNVYLHVLQGKGVFTINDKETYVSKDDVLLVTGDELLSFANNSNEDVSLYVILNKIPNEKYAENI
ncbi:cupin domain-containing protein [Aquibacillus rhizosphaerae]|uniref:Cupin domain-containing protein n=1 Tax=Aquibacillus rhizosphaerae TaxID=3051431 RepID=A0ABT7L9X6_9BACI|nr:cupin domain-containing protein [Aquibacillus sp. LR5S19]MDL4842664.1 cupin domain-containing protein [Aquibacillus sp. LR5S19]